MGLLWRAAWLQIVQPELLVRESDLRSLRVQTIPVTRGIITDRTGSPLAVSVSAGAVWVDAQKVLKTDFLDGEMGIRWRCVAEALGIPLTTLRSRIQANPKSHFIYLARQIAPDVTRYIHDLSLPGLYVSAESRRFYPAGEAIAHLIGCTDIDGVGIEGIEKCANGWLTGHPGQRIVRKDGSGRVVEDLRAVERDAAQNLCLTIDERLQILAYRALKKAVTYHKAEAGSAVLVNVQTGEILALVNTPSYNPNNRVQALPNTFRNRAVTDLFEPGSTVKPFVILKALQDRKVQQQSVIDTSPGMLRLNGHWIRDIRNYGILTLSGVLQKSSNVAVSKLALTIPSEELVQFYRSFGLGVATSTGLLGESRGVLLNKKQWSDLERATFAFGYGLAVTPLQLARAYATLGSFGILRPLSIMQSRQQQPIDEQRIVDAYWVRQVVQMMERVTAPGSAGARAAVPGYRVAVKTGTTRIAEAGGYSRHYLSYTAGVAPVSHPRLALVVVVCNPTNGDYYGGAVAGPLFSTIMEGALRIWNIEPDGPTFSKEQWVNNWGKKIHAAN